MDFRMQPRTERVSVSSSWRSCMPRRRPRADRPRPGGHVPGGGVRVDEGVRFPPATVPEEFGGSAGVRPRPGRRAVPPGSGRRVDGHRGQHAPGLRPDRRPGTCAVPGRHGDEQEATMSGYLTILGAGTIAIANATEPGTDLRHPLVEAVRVDGGWSLTGARSSGRSHRSPRCSSCPFRTAATTAVAAGFAIVPRGSAGPADPRQLGRRGHAGLGEQRRRLRGLRHPAEFVTVRARGARVRELPRHRHASATSGSSARSSGSPRPRMASPSS